MRIIQLFNSNLKYRFKIDWEEMSGNINITELKAFREKLNSIFFEPLLKFKRSLMINESDILFDTLNKKYKNYGYTNIAKYPESKHIDKLLDYQGRDLLEPLEKYYSVYAGNEYAIKTVERYINNYEYMTILRKYILEFTENQTLFCSREEKAERKILF